jgi:hypothetical protein
MRNNSARRGEAEASTSLTTPNDKIELVRPIAHAVPAALIELLRTTPLSDGKVTFSWRTAVGPAVERATAVKLDRGVLIVETTSKQWAQEVLRSTSVILTRMQGFLGPETVSRIEVRTNPNLKSAI